MQGNNACAAGALAVGCRFFAGYPITPSSEIAETMARELPRLGGKFIQMEDEIASIAAVIGASVGGLKAMTATSGPGFSLMQENIGYAIVAEVPCVIVNVMRAGPSTGLPTSPSQGDVMQARWGTHGEGYRYHITGLLHDPRGFPTNRLDEIQPWVERIFRKVDRDRNIICTWEEDGIEDARILVVSFGSTARAASQAVKVARARYGRKVGLLRLKTLWPFPEEALERAAENVQRIIVAEMNLGQVALEVERVAGRGKVVRVGRADGQMVTPGQILDAMRVPLTHAAPRPAPAKVSGER